MCQTALVLPGLSPLQRFQAVWAAAVGWIFPFLTEVHAVLPHMVTWKETTQHSAHYFTQQMWFSTRYMVLPFSVFMTSKVFAACHISLCLMKGSRNVDFWSQEVLIGLKLPEVISLFPYNRFSSREMCSWQFKRAPNYITHWCLFFACRFKTKNKLTGSNYL